MFSPQKRLSGLTIPELLVVTTIIWILSTIGFVSFSKYNSQARDTTRSTDIKNISRVLDLHNTTVWRYPVATDSVDITYSGAIVWSQWIFGKDTAAETWKIFGDLVDPAYWNGYTYSTTINRKEYQLAAVFENENIASELVAMNFNFLDFAPTAYASTDFSPLEFSPKIWLDATDINGDDNYTNNPSDSSTVSTWVNKSSAGSANNPQVTHSSIQYTDDGFDGNYPWVFISTADGLLLTNSDITVWDIFYVVQKNDPFGSTDSNGYGLYSNVDDNYKIGYHNRYRDALRIGSAPRHHNSSPATTSSRTSPFVYGFHTDNSNYSFRDTWNLISQGGTNSITWHTWAFNKWWAVTNKNSDLVVSEILIFDVSLSSTDRQKVEWYLAHKWWQDYYLNNSHPYKDAPPEWATPPTPDTTPDNFVFSDVTDADIWTLYTSNSITVEWINSWAPISISWGFYSINSTVNYTDLPGMVNIWDVVRVRQTSSNSSSTSTSTTLNIGGVSESFTVTTLFIDDTPDAFSFSDVGDADLSTEYFSNAITVSGLNTQVDINISWDTAQYKISDWVPTDISSWWSASASSTYFANTSEWWFDNNTSSNGWWNNNALPAWLEYDLGVGEQEQVTSYTLYRSSSQSWWWTSDNWSPKNWTFEWSDDGSNWIVLDTRTNQRIRKNQTKQVYSFTNSNYYRYYRINISSAYGNNTNWVNITEMEMINEEGVGVFTSSPGIVENGDIVSMKITSSTSPGVTKTGSLTIGTLTESFNVTTTAPDTIPDSFSFTDVEWANLWASYISNNITVWWINTLSPISISGVWEYRINAWAYQTASSTVSNGDIINIRQNASPSNSQTVSSTLTIGWVSATYNVTTPAPPPDTTPDSFSFTSETNANMSDDYFSDTITVSWINTASPITITWGEYDINGSNSYTSSAGNVTVGDTITLKNTASASPNTTTNAVLTIGWVSASYSVTTVPTDSTPSSLDPIVIDDINVPVDISVSWWEYNINGGTWTSSSWVGAINDGDVVLVRNTSPNTWWASNSITLTVWGVSDNFSLTNWPWDSTPDSFSFTDINESSLNTLYTSDAITVTGINAPTNVNISGWEYIIVWETPSYTTAPWVVYNNQQIRVRQVSSIDWNTQTSAILTLWSVSDSFDVTTVSFIPSNTETPSAPVSNIFVWWDYNWLISYASTGSTHFVIATPSIITSDLSDTDIESIIANKKLVYDGFENTPWSYMGQDFTATWSFNFNISSPILYSWTRENLWSYGWLKQIDEGIRSTYSTFPAYRNVASYLDDFSLWYLEKIIGQNIGINPIKPYYCSDILRSKLVYNVAPSATITATPNTTWWWYGTWGIANGGTSTQWDLDYEYHSDSVNWQITFEWEKSQKIWFIRIYNRTWCCSERLSWATIQLYNSIWWLIYSHALWDTRDDFVIDLDLEWIGRLYDVNKVVIQAVGGNYLNLREVEIFLWWNLQDGIYKVDKDGLGWLSPYNVYCDMTTDGWGWTRIGDEFIENWELLNQQDMWQYTWSGVVNINDNLIVSHLTQQPPESIPDAFVLQHNGGTNVSYQLFFDSIPGEFFAQEIRLWVWVKDTNASLFKNTIKYADNQSVTSTPDYDIIETNGDWEYHMVRIPLDGLVDDFIWDIWGWAAWRFHFTWASMEVYYR